MTITPIVILNRARTNVLTFECCLGQIPKYSKVHVRCKIMFACDLFLINAHQTFYLAIKMVKKEQSAVGGISNVDSSDGGSFTSSNHLKSDI